MPKQNKFTCSGCGIKSNYEVLPDHLCLKCGEPKKLILPTGYLSYSQWVMWRQNESRYHNEYFAGKEKLDTKYLRFGKGAAQVRENRVLKPGEQTELEIRVDIKGVPVLSYIDFYDGNNHVFEEDKTGKEPWTQSRVQRHEQLPFYATVLKAKTGIMPKSCTLNWFQTKENKDGSGLQNEIEFTGVEKSFTREFDERECDRIEDSIEKVANEISDAYKKFIEEI